MISITPLDFGHAKLAKKSTHRFDWIRTRPADSDVRANDFSASRRVFHVVSGQFGE